MDLSLCWEPHDGQKLIKQALFGKGHKTVFLECGRKFGKLNRLDEPIFTPSGWKRFGDLIIGSKVFDEQGNVQRVTYITPVTYDHPAYKVTFCNGSTMEVGEDHRWLTWTKRDRKNERRGLKCSPSVKSTKEIYETLMCGKEYNHSIPYAKPLNLTERNFPLDPYLLGAWLGDGSSNGANFTTVDQEILQQFRDAGYEITDNNRYCEWYIKGLVATLKEMNLIKNKHIPSEYLLGSKEQRLALVQGLMDTDGIINSKGNHCCFDNTNYELARSFYHLVASLGMKPIWKERRGKLYGVPKKMCYRVQFKPLLPVFRLKRKLERLNINKVKRNHHTIVNVERVQSSPMQCISVTGESHLYLIGESLIPTHNTETLAYLLYRYALSFPNAACYFIAPFQKQARELIWANNRLQNFFMPLVDPKTKRTHKGHTILESHQIMEELNEKYGVKVNDSEMRIRFGNGSFIKLDGADNHQAYRGVNPHLIVYDEFKDHHPKFHTGMEPNLATYEAPLIIVGTPCEGDEPNEKSFNSIADYAKLADDQSYFQLPTAINPHISKKWLKDKRRELFAKGEDDKWYREYCALRVKAGQKSIFPMLDKETHTIPEKEMLSIYGKHRKDYDIYCGFDPASSSTFAVVLIAIHKYNKRILVLDEIYETDKAQMSTRPIWIKTQKLLSKWNIREEDVRFIYDYAAAWFANEVADKFNVGLEPCYKDIGKNKEKRLSLIKDCLLLKDCFLINRDTVRDDYTEGSGLFWEMQNYRVDDKGKIPKENDHAIDCISGDSLIFTKRGFIRMDEVVVGDTVATNLGWDKVTDHWLVGSRPVMKVNELICTLDHRIFTLNKGWTKARSLTHSDTLCSFRDGGFVWKMMLLFTKVLSSLGGQTRREEMIGSISRRTRGMVKKESNIYTDIFTNKKLEKFLTATLFTILTVIRSIMIPLIWSVLLLKSIMNITIKEIVLMPKDVILIIFGILLKIGIGRKKEGRYTVGLLRKCGKKWKKLKSHAKSAEKSIWSSLKSLTEASFATKIVELEPLEKEELVYDLTTENHSRFFANGVLVHNCLRYLLSNAHYDDAPISPPGKNPNDMRRGFTPDQDISENTEGFSVDREIMDEFYY